MLTISEIAVTATIWGLTATGGFFGIRAAFRRKKLEAAREKALTTNTQNNIQIHRETESIKRR